MVEYFDLSFCRQDFHHKLEFCNVEEGGNEECEDNGNVGRISHYTVSTCNSRLSAFKAAANRIRADQFISILVIFAALS